ncbi:MAG: hypothetical protein JNK25_03315 [Phycisphaerae bacterium]|nr:hypothetical protein [Phycisphaerae bacterium]
MPTLGRFETVEELASSGPFAVSSAREGGGEPVLAAKTFRLQDDLADPEVVARRAAAFLGAARLQQSLTGKGDSHWAKIHDSGQTADFAYYITDLAPLTAQRLVESRRDLDARSLVALLTAVTEGLIELREATGGGDLGRAHGELKPGNVLLMDGEPTGAVLCDPAPEDRLEHDARLTDLKSLGGLLFQLVVHRPPPAANEVRKGPEWDRMGQQGEGLRALCEALLNPTAAGTDLTHEEIKKRLAAVLLMRPRRTGLPLPVKLGIAAVLLGAAGGGVWFATRPPATKTADTPGLVDTDKDPREADDGGLRTKLADAAAALNDAKAEFESFGEEGTRRFTQLTGDVSAAERELADNARADWGTLPMDAKEIPPALTAQRDPIRQRHEAIKQRIETLPGKIAVARDGLRLSKAAAGASRAVVGVGDTFAAGQKRAESLSEEARQAYAKLRERWAALNTEAEAAAASASAFAGEGADALDQQLARLTSEAAALDADRVAWKSRYDEAGRKLEERIQADRLAFKMSDSGLSSNDLFEAIKPRLFKEALDYAETGEATEDGYIQLRRSLLQRAKAAEDAVVPPPITHDADGSGIATEAVEAARRALAARAASRLGDYIEGNDFAGWSRFSPAADPVLKAESAKVAAWSSGLGVLLDDVRRIERMLADGYGWSESGPGGATIERSRAALADSAALKDLDAKSAEVNPRSGRELAGNEAFRDLAAAMRAVATRADALAAVSGMNTPTELMRLIESEGGDPSSVARVLAAWKQLAATEYPRNISELDAAAQVLASKITPAAARIRDESRRASAADAASGVIPAMWLSLVNTRLGTRPEDVKAAFDPARMRGWGVNSDTPTGLSAPAAYNLARVRLLESLASMNGDENTLKQLVSARASEFLNAVNAIPGIDAYRGSPALANVQKAMALYAAGKWTYLPGDGPAAVAGRKWLSDDSRVEGDNLAVSYSSPVGNEVLRFRRVDVTGDDLHFVSTTEVSVGMLMEILAAAGVSPSRTNDRLEKANLIQRDYTRDANCKRDSNDDGRNGPRAWDFVSCGIAPSTPETGNPTLGWIKNCPGIGKLEPAYAPGLTVLPPSAATPMNYVSPAFAAYAAALAGCRLPTPEEWAAAARQNSGPTNRRDGAWAEQLRHIVGLRGSNAFEQIVLDTAAPYAGIFRSAEDSRGTIDQNPAVNDNDGVLWFAPVADGGGEQFRHLIGNVAEYIYEDSAALASLTAQGAFPDPAAYTRFARDNAARFKVIGASALSPPTSSPETPLGLTRWPKEGYSDVGFRLAFTASGAGGGNVARRAVEKLDSIAFLAP